MQNEKLTLSRAAALLEAASRSGCSIARQQAALVRTLLDELGLALPDSARAAALTAQAAGELDGLGLCLAGGDGLGTIARDPVAAE